MTPPELPTLRDTVKTEKEQLWGCCPSRGAGDGVNRSGRNCLDTAFTGMV